MIKNPDVDKYLADKQHPMTTEIEAVREIILSYDPKLEECIKWSSPTFTYKGNMASFFMNAKKHVSLMFHKGALIASSSKILEGDGKEGRVAKFSDLDDIKNKKAELENVVKAWMELQDNS